MRGETDDPRAPSADRWLTLANALTAVRLLLVPGMVHAVVTGAFWGAFAIFWLAVVTDLVDGRVARLRGEASRLGGLLDHATDALFVSAGLAAFATRDVVPVALPPLVALAFAQYAIDSRVLAGRRLRTSAIGRVNGIAYYVLLGVPVVRDALSLGWPSDPIVRLLGWGLVLSTGISMGDRAIAWLATRRARGSHASGR